MDDSDANSEGSGGDYVSLGVDGLETNDMHLDEEGGKRKNRPRTVAELTNFIQLSGIEVGRVAYSANPEEVKDIGKPVWAMMISTGEVQPRVNGGRLVADYHVMFTTTQSLSSLRPRLNLLYQRSYTFIAAYQSGVIDEIEFHLLHKDTRLLTTAFGICHEYKLMGLVPVTEQERRTTYPGYRQDKAFAERVVETMRERYPDGAEIFCVFSVARAAGYYATFRDAFPAELSDAGNDRARFDGYLVKACHRFWMAGKGDKPSRPKALYPRNGSIQDWATKYQSNKGPKWLKKEHLQRFEPLLNSSQDLLRLQAASLLFAKIHLDKPNEAAQDRKEYTDEARALINERFPTEEDPQLAAQMSDEELIYLGPIIFTSRWHVVLEDYLELPGPLELPQCLGYIPGYTPVSSGGSDDILKHIRIYKQYVKKCAKFGGNALVVLFLGKMKETVSEPLFDLIKEVIDACLENNEFEITKAEWEHASKGAPGAQPPAALVDSPTPRAGKSD